jgi:signal transduction histidine kinase
VSETAGYRDAGGTGELRKYRVLAREVTALRHRYEVLKEQSAVMHRQLVALRIIQQVAQNLTLNLDLDSLLKQILRSAVQVMQASAGSLLLLDPTSDELVFAVIEGGGGTALEGQRLPKGVGIAGWVAEHGEPLIVDDVTRDKRYFPGIAEDLSFEITSLICVPMMAKGQLIGVLQILNKKSGEPFTNEDQETLSTFAAQSAIAIENTRLYQDLREERDRIVAVEEEVRKRLASDLHDGPAQLLAAIIMNVKFVQDLLERSAEQAIAELSRLDLLASKALLQVRTLLFDLRPVILETHGLVPALESYVKRLNEAGDIDYHLIVREGVPRLSRKAEAAIFSVVQEAVNNARKHADAQHVLMIVDRKDDRLQVTIRDDGKGFELKGVETNYSYRGSLGLLNMRERAEIIQADLRIESVIGKGTAVRLDLPITMNLLPPDTEA